jgi:hypothetical protein
MSHTNDATPKPHKVTLTLDTQGPFLVEIWSQPAPCAEVKPFSSELYFPTAGRHGASFELPQLCKRPSTSEARHRNTLTHESPNEMQLSSNSVPQGSHHRLLLSAFSKPIDQSLETQPRNTTSCNTPAPQSPLALPGSPDAATIADSDGGSPSASRVAATAVSSIVPTAAGIMGDPSELPPLLRRKRGREDSEEDQKIERGDGNASKRRRVLASPR